MEGREQGHRAASVFLIWQDVTLHFADAREDNGSDSVGEAPPRTIAARFSETPRTAGSVR